MREMREILFRGKQTHNGEWIEGSLIHADLMDGRTYTCILPKDETTVHPTDWPYLCCESGTFDGWASPIDSKTVGQYTGLTDKNTRKIFEGDIVKVDGCEKTYEVKYMLGKFFIGINMPVAYKRFDCEVIGNIHDNPELLKEGGEP